MYNIGERRCDKIMKIQYNSKSNWNFDSSYKFDQNELIN